MYAGDNGTNGARPVPRAVGRSERPTAAVKPTVHPGDGLLSGTVLVKEPPTRGSSRTVTAQPLVGTPDMRTRQTVAAMRAVTLDSLRDPAIVDRAAAIVRDLDGRDRAGQIRAIRAWLAANVRFLPDPLIDGDVIRTPSLLLRQLKRDGFMQGDCDDVATLAATLGHAVGIPARFVTLGFFGPTAPFRHVFAELEDTAGQWHEMDVTESEQTRTHAPTRRETHDVLAAGAGMGSLLGLAQVVYVAAQLLKALEGIDDV